MTTPASAPGTAPDVAPTTTASPALKRAPVIPTPAPHPAAAIHPGIASFAPPGAPYPSAVPGYPEIDLTQVPDDGSFNPLLDPNYTALQLALAQAVERDPEGATAFYLETCGKGPRAMVRRIVDGIVPGAPVGCRRRARGKVRAIPGTGTTPSVSKAHARAGGAREVWTARA